MYYCNATLTAILQGLEYCNIMQYHSITSTHFDKETCVQFPNIILLLCKHIIISIRTKTFQ